MTCIILGSTLDNFINRFKHTKCPIFVLSVIFYTSENGLMQQQFGSSEMFLFITKMKTKSSYSSIHTLQNKLLCITSMFYFHGSIGSFCVKSIFMFSHIWKVKTHRTKHSYGICVFISFFISQCFEWNNWY